MSGNFEQGYIKLHRKILENPISEKPHYAWLWIILLLKANHKTAEFIWNGEKKTIKAGQFITGREKLSQESHISQGTVERILKYLENEQQIKQETNNKFRIITIVNWEKYQINGQQTDSKTDNQRTTNGQQTDTNNNDKNVKNDKNTIAKAIVKLPVSKENLDVTAVYEYLKKQLNGTPDGSQIQNRRFATLLLNRFKKDYPNKNPVELIEKLIEYGLKDEFHSKNITSFKYLYYNAQKIIQSIKGRIKNPKVITI